MDVIEKELLTKGNTTKDPMQSVKEFLDGYKQYKVEKKNLLESYKENTEIRVEV